MEDTDYNAVTMLDGNAKTDSMSDIDPYYSDDSVMSGNHSVMSTEDNIAEMDSLPIARKQSLLYQRVPDCNSHVSREISPNTFSTVYDQRVPDDIMDMDVSQSKAYLNAALLCLDQIVEYLERNDLGEARKHCIKVYDILQDIHDPALDSDKLTAYNTCCCIFQQCGDHEYALECYYKGFWIKKLEIYPVHASEALAYWIPLIEGLNFVKLIALIRTRKAETDKQFASNPTGNCDKALYIYLDLNISLRSVQEDFQLAKAVVEDVRCILIQITKCFLLKGKNEQVCKICRDIDTKFPVTIGSSMIGDFFQTWSKALGNLKKFDVARKKIQQGLEMVFTKEDKDAAKCLLSQINLMEDENREPANDTVDSDDEYVRGSNYSTLEQQRQQAEEAKAKHHKRTARRRPKRNSESQDYINATWTELPKKRRGRKRHLTASSTGSQASEDSEQLPLPEAHANSDIDSDKEFDTMSRSDWFGSPDSSSEDESDLEDFSNVDQFEKSSRKFDDGSDEIDEQGLLLQGISLSDKFIEEHRKPSQNKNHFTYPEFYSDEKNAELCRRNPLKFKKCKVRIESSHGAVCTNLDHSDDIQEIEISGRSKIGKVFNEDEVYVEVLQDERDAYKNKNYIPRLQKTLDLSKMSLKVFGQIRGVKQRHHHPDIDHPVFVCVLDESEFHLMLPISKTVPKLHILNRKCQNKYQVDVYRYIEDKGYLVHKELFDIKPGEIKNYIFLVAMICWENLYPLGAVIKVINAKDGLNSGMEILRLHHQVPTGYKLETVETVKMLKEQGHKLVKKEEREDLTDLEVFTIDPTDSRDLDDALSIEENSEGNYRIGVHIADVTAIIKKGDYIDCEAYDRATTFYPGQGRNPYHMLPEPLSTNLCSLIPGQPRPVISIFFTCDKEGKPLEKHEIKKTVIRSRQKLTYREAQDVLLNIGRNVSDSICKQIKNLFTIAESRRIRRLGGAMYHVPIETDDDDFMETKEAHFLVEEFMILANHTIGTYLFRKFKNCVPLRIQQPPEPECVQQWLISNDFFADLILKLQEVRPLPAIESERKLSVNNARTGRYNRVLMFQQHVWNKLHYAFRRKDFPTVMQILGCDEIHPFACLGLEEWYEFQETAEYKCSGDIQSKGATKKDGSHFSLGMFPYIHFTSPIRRYVDIISHRLLHCALDEKKPCYSPEEISDMCHHINEVTRRAKAYQNKCRALNWGYKLRKESTVFHGFVKTVSEKEVTVVIPGHRNLPKESCTLQLNSLGSTKKPVFKKDTNNGREILELQWKKRLYSYNGFAPIKRQGEDKIYRVNPHNRAFFQQQNKWKQLQQAVIDEKTSHGKLKKLEKIFFNGDLGHPEANLEEYIPACFKTERDVSSEVRKGTITLQSCEYSMTFNHGQVLALQMSAESVKGVLIPQIEIFDMTKNVRYCLLHVKDPIKYLEKYSTDSTKDFYHRPADYIRTWKPLVEMEAATNAINVGTATINDVPVKFLSQREGKFSLRKAFLEQRNIEINKVPLEVYLNPGKEHKEGDEEEGIREVASPDYLCIKSVEYLGDGEVPGNEFGHTHGCAPQGYRIWHGHAKIERVNVKGEKGKIDFIFKLHKSSQPVPFDFRKDDVKPRCGIEVLFKSSADCRIDGILQCLDKANPLPKAIALGTKIPKLDKGHFEIGRKMQPDIMNIDGIVRNNPKQYNAIQRALESSFSLIQGPPGTGKTYTGIKLVYLFNQINLKWQEMGNEKKQIIFCGPSNKSVDLVAKWMKRKLGEHCPKMVRWYGSSIEDQEFPIPGKTPTLGRGERAVADEQLREYSMHIQIRQLGKPYMEEITAFDRQFRQHPDGVDYKDVNKYRKLIHKAVIEEVSHYDVIFCTTAMATNLRIMAGTNGRIFQIIVDECGMCTEPESMAAIIATRAQQVVLIGDHKQLRPIVMSSNAAKLGLEKSLFERYAEKGKMLTMLTSQYRMHPEICAFPSKQFYKNRLETMPSYTWRTDSPLKSWLKQNTPVIFCHVEGTEEYLPFNTEEGNEQSCSNKQEVDQVVKVFKHLVEDELIDPHYINIMSQYNSQCHSIRQELKKDKFIQFNVNTVVASQGGEWDYVVISLVRSLPDYRIEPKPTLGWCKQNLGFITDEHQTNVALTRARKGLIVVGNQKLLKCNDVWANFLNHYGQKGCVVDCDKFPPPPQRIQERKQRKKKSRRVQEMDEEFYSRTEEDPNQEEESRPE
ncbi:helicase with zinc finger domain 2-like [Mytilus californianus]|uniref:helicase with zinc finger domain 2-like n=1 Tax=Mytilus californianus TaxID=6549 RepID=UPI002246CE18|nr:helicase with zinc finger domain 2-like [Mytilus californianus]XP_052090429.1 helicase with zinc finger domain 2-like [Mytilus californianus]